MKTSGDRKPFIAPFIDNFLTDRQQHSSFLSQHQRHVAELTATDKHLPSEKHRGCYRSKPPTSTGFEREIEQHCYEAKGTVR